MDPFYNQLSITISRQITKAYSTSFSIGVRCLDPSIRDAIYSIYGFVRCADEIVDTFHHPDQSDMLAEYEQEYYRSLQRRVSSNPVINAFRHTVEQYQIPDELIQAFLHSMRRDLSPDPYSEEEIRQYIFGSADVVGLMCLKVFVNGDNDSYLRLKPYAMRLGSAFQKINFLRDIGHDTTALHRVYFPVLQTQSLNTDTLKVILEDIEADYQQALIGIRQLPKCARLGVYVAYRYYRSLTERIAQISPEGLMQQRIRINSAQKMALFIQAMVENKMNIYR